MSIVLNQSESDRSSPPASLESDSLVSGLSFMLFANVFQRGLGFIRNIAICRFLVDEQLGLWALATSFFILAAPLAALGLPGTFGRLVSTYRASGQLQVFLRRIALGSSVGALAFVSYLVLAPVNASSLIFGVELSRSTMSLLAVTLCFVILFNASTEFLGGLRKPRLVSAMHTCNSTVFTLASLVGVLCFSDWRTLVAATAIASVAGLVPAIVAMRSWRFDDLPTKVSMVSNREMWRRVLPFAASIWCMNLLVNLFDVVDRYMIMHLATETVEQGRALVGQFHSGRIMPMLLSSLSLMLSGILLPYLAADWEAGHHAKVANSQRLTLKCASLFFFALSVASMAVAPLLFHSILQGKYTDGLAIMPQAMLHCCFAALAVLMQNYFWCAERGRTVGIIVAIGLVLNVALNAWWVPIWGLRGAMTATSVSGAAILSLTLLEMSRSGVRLGKGTIWFCLLPISILLGTVPAACLLATFCFVTGRTNWLLSMEEKRTIDLAITSKLQGFGLPIQSIWSIPNR